MKVLAFVFALVGCALAASAEEIVLKNGKVVQGIIWKEIGGTVILKGENGILLNVKNSIFYLVA
jgi:hypothetical protein